MHIQGNSKIVMRQMRPVNRPLQEPYQPEERAQECTESSFSGEGDESSEAQHDDYDGGCMGRVQLEFEQDMERRVIAIYETE